MQQDEPVVRAFSWRIRVYWEDTDAGGVVYHASYLRFLERARTEWLRSFGVEQQSFRDETGLAFLVREMQIDFLAAARLDEELLVTVEVAGLRPASLLLAQTIRRAGDSRDLLRARVRAACVELGRMRPAPIPEDLLARIS